MGGVLIFIIFMINFSGTLRTIFTMAAVLVFPVSVLLIELKCKIGNTVLRFLGNISFELYMIHSLWIRVFENISNEIVIAVLVIMFSIVSAAILNIIFKYILGYLKKYM